MKNMIKEYRKAQKITQEEMARLLNVSRQTYINYESGAFEPSFETLIQISKILKTSIDDLLNNEVYPSRRDVKIKQIIAEVEGLLDKYK